MTKISKLSLPAILLLSALALSACATKPKEEKAPAAPAAVVEQPAATPAAAEQFTPAPTVAAETPAPKKVAKKHKHKAKAAPVKVEEPAPVAAPEPAPAPVAAPAPAPAPAPVVAAPVQPVAEKGFLEKSWMWLLAIIILAVGIFFVVKRKQD